MYTNIICQMLDMNHRRTLTSYQECGQSQLLFWATCCLHGTNPEIKTKHINHGYRGLHSFLNEKNSTWITRNRKNIEVLISEARGSVIDERELFSRRKEEIQRQREERQEEEFRNRAEKRRKKRMQLEKTKWCHCQLWLVEIGPRVQTETEGAKSYIRQM